MWHEIAQSIQSGNVYMIVILSLCFISILITCERLFVLQYVYNMNFSYFNNHIRKMLSSNDYDRARQYCERSRRKAVSQIAIHAIDAAENDPTTIQGIIEEHLITTVSAIEKRLSLFPTLSILAVLAGLLGTFDAMWDTFYSVGILNTAQKQVSLARGIAVSLNPTSASLLVATFVIVFYQLTKSFATRVAERVELSSTILCNCLLPPGLMGAQFQMPVESSASEDEKKSKKPKQEESASNAQQEKPDVKDEEEII